MISSVPSLVVDLPSNSQYEHWVVVEPSGVIRYHGENDGAYFLRKGACAVDKGMSLDDVRREYPDKVVEIGAHLAGPQP